MLLKLFFLLTISSTTVAFAKSKDVYVNFFKMPMGTLHEKPSRYSAPMTTVSCGQPIKVVMSTGEGEWKLVEVGPYRGYIHREFIGASRPLCFQDRYSKFFEKFEMNISDLYYWGRLYDQYVPGESKL